MFQGEKKLAKVLQQLWVLGAVGDDGLDAWPWFHLQVIISILGLTIGIGDSGPDIKSYSYHVIQEYLWYATPKIEGASYSN